MNILRRDFLSRSAQIAAFAALSPLVSLSAESRNEKKAVASNKIRLALIGGNNMGFNDLKNALKIPDFVCTAVCDIDDAVLDKCEKEIIDIQGKKPRRYKDFRKLLEDKEVDSVIIGTPDHWHCLMTVAACEAGKDVYVEKPMANSIEECNIMVKAARKYNRIVQVGQQQRSGKHWHDVMQYIKKGGIGQLRQTRIWANMDYAIGLPKAPDSKIPSGVDYDMWLGPAPERAFNVTRFHRKWRMFWDYGGGLMTDWGVHLIDMALWAKDITEPPVSAVASGGNFAFPECAHETFDTLSVNWQMKDHVISWENTAGTQIGQYDQNYGIAFVGNNATLVANRMFWKVIPGKKDGKDKIPAIPYLKGDGDTHLEHLQNFADCIKSRKEPVCPVEVGRNVAIYAHMGNIALRTDSKLYWDPVKQNFGNNNEANKLITPAYRKPWKLPEI